jgi:hypothetical protein
VFSQPSQTQSCRRSGVDGDLVRQPARQASATAAKMLACSACRHGYGWPCSGRLAVAVDASLSRVATTFPDLPGGRNRWLWLPKSLLGSSVGSAFSHAADSTGLIYRRSIIDGRCVRSTAPRSDPLPLVPLRFTTQRRNGIVKVKATGLLGANTEYSGTERTHMLQTATCVQVQPMQVIVDSVQD